jgi:hypothetical protein
MKKLITSCLLLLVFVSGSVFGQSTRLVLAEEFTNASCGPCASQNPAFNALLDGNSTKVVAIKYQTNWPGTDPMNAKTQSIVGPRVTYYSVTGVPWAAMDGVAQTGSSYSGAPANWTQTKLNTQAAVASPFTLTASHSFNTAHDSIFVTVDIAASLAVSGTLVAHVALVERTIEFCKAPGSNGEDLFESVMMDMYPGVNGTTLATSWTVGQTQQITFSKKLPSYLYDLNRVAIVAFIQDNANKTVHQAAFSAPQPLANDAKLGCGSVGNPEINCGTSWTPSVSIKNNGSQNLTSATINFKVDGVAGTPIPWTGNLTPNASASVSLPAVTSVPGSRTLEFEIVNPNGQQDINIGQDKATLTYYDFGTVGVNPPTQEAFTTSTFPPGPNWRNVNFNAGAGWTRSSTGLNGAGSARMYFWGSATGQIDELWVPNQDFSLSGVTSAQIEFDLAAAQYQTSNDRMEILYSTDCGVSWTSVFNEAGAVLAAGNAPAATNWTPASSSDWHHKIINLTGAVGQPSVFIKFKATSDNGNNCFIDNINVSTNLSVSVPQVISFNEFNVYPNPSASGLINVQLGLQNNESISIVVTNAMGAVVKSMNLENVSSGVFPVDLSQEAKGTYEVSVVTKDQVLTKRVSIIE